jgi:hypothetical protein
MIDCFTTEMIQMKRKSGKMIILLRKNDNFAPAKKEKTFQRQKFLQRYWDCVFEKLRKAFNLTL